MLPCMGTLQLMWPSWSICRAKDLFYNVTLSKKETENLNGHVRRALYKQVKVGMKRSVTPSAYSDLSLNRWKTRRYAAENDPARATRYIAVTQRASSKSSLQSCQFHHSYMPLCHLLPPQPHQLFPLTKLVQLIAKCSTSSTSSLWQFLNTFCSHRCHLLLSTSYRGVPSLNFARSLLLLLHFTSTHHAVYFFSINYLTCTSFECPLLTRQ